MRKIVVIGGGYVGLITALGFAELQYPVICIENEVSKLKKLTQGISPIHEPKVKDLLFKHHQKGTLQFSASLKDVLLNNAIIFIAVGTPSLPSGEADLSALFSVIHQLALLNSWEKGTLVIKSTVPPGTLKKAHALFKHNGGSEEIIWVSNPEFLREGSALDDFFAPDRIILGCDTKSPTDIICLYETFEAKGVPILVTSSTSAEMIKYASNSFLATKVSFINEICRLCHQIPKTCVQDVAKGMGLDPRIGPLFLNAGPGIGGSCFPKDARALAFLGKKSDSPVKIVEQTLQSNILHQIAMVKQILSILDFDINQSLTLGLWGITFKANTDDVRESPALFIAKELSKKNIKLQIYDPAGIHNAQKELDDKTVVWCKDSYHAAKNADAVIVLTEWELFKSLSFAKIKTLLKKPIIIDLRNCLINISQIKTQKFFYHALDPYFTCLAETSNAQEIC